jgi:hypothetical protein
MSTMDTRRWNREESSTGRESRNTLRLMETGFRGRLRDCLLIVSYVGIAGTRQEESKEMGADHISIKPFKCL